ncbi:hypothetical protein B0T18DRAFT_84621 [Schizothecium vesticola]|uniref:C2H2-type domain-containing protein n=1 Tax=Schizothecium vesticola TaxID=314040 RepID=A0AA40KB27_9PEZI|nr:hypothetical protein B0T18DRAFT_84621 [Schizothecium vesticola]
MAASGHRDSEDYAMSYPEPPQYGNTPVALSPEAYPSYPRQPSLEFSTSSMGYDANGPVYADAPFMYHAKSSPGGMYGDDGSDMRVPSSNLSIASASSSNIGSPLSNHGALAPIPEWAAAPHGIGGVTPGIVDHQGDYHYPGSEYSFAPGGIDAFTPTFEFVSPKGPGFVGKSPQFSRSRLSSLSLSGPLSLSLSRGSSMSSSASACTMVPARSSYGILALDTRLAQAASVTASPHLSSASTMASSLVFASPATSLSSFSSPTPPVWCSPLRAAPDSPRPEPQAQAQAHTPRLLSPFFSQSSGHFVPPLDSSYPSLIHPDVRTMAMPGFDQSYPAPNSAYPGSPALSASPQLRSGNTSPFMQNSNYQPYSPFQPPPAEQQRRASIASFSAYSGDQQYSGDEKEKQRCPHHDCGKVYKDLKAHMLTHQMERPEKCPIATCEYHVKGFARKYDKNRHTLTHYKGTMVCGFCPGSGSAAEKSFNRADVFKRHLTAVHGVEQTAPNSRKKGSSGSSNGAKKLTGYAPDATGKCSTCTQTFNNAQDFYEHLDDCVLRIVQQEDPAEAINAQRLAEVENDRDVHATLEKNHLPTTTMMLHMDEDDMDDEMDDEDDEDVKRGLKSSTSPSRRTKGNPPNGVQKSRGLTHSRGGVPLLTKSKGRKNRRDYPSSWGFDKGQMNMKKRVLAVFDGPRRLAKDDMMLSMEHEVRVKLADGKSYVTDLDIQTVRRAEGFHEATDEEKGPWVSDDPTEEQLKQMLAIDVEALTGKP